MKRIIIAHPRCGLTWIRVFLTLAGITGGKKEAKREENNYVFKHDGIGLRHTRVEIIKMKSMQVESVLQAFFVCFLIRDPRDVIESNFRILKRYPLKKEYKPREWNRFFHSRRIGLVPLLRWWQWWDERQEKCEGWHLIQFEETKRNPREAFRGLLKFFEYELSVNLFTQAFDFSRTPELVEKFKPKDVRRVNTAGGSSKKWKRWTEEDQQWAIEQMKKYPSSFSERYVL